MNNLPFVSVIIATYNREELLCSTIKDLFIQKYWNENNSLNFEIIVVDQTIEHKAATTKFLNESIAKNKIRYIKTAPPNLPRARNIGINESKGQVLVFVDDDVRIGPDFIKNHVNNYIRNNQTGGVAGKVNIESNVYLKTATTQHTKIKNSTNPATSKKINQIKDWWLLTFNSEEYGPIASAIGCNMSFTKSALQKINGFDENFIQDSNKEETDVCFRLRKAGYEIIFDPLSELTHLIHQAGGTRDTQKDLTLSQNFYRNQFYFFFKNLACRQLPKYTILTYRYFVCREKGKILTSKKVFLKFLKRNLQFIKGIYSGYRTFKKSRT